ncbi:hypothetical protein [Fulvivirga sedimenti]|uniref:Thioredoxin domain-containing protein n=1 Tax=Fulvivirga sedimenti TaxID=2879465 RepID=A0A9X1HY83_9BACT|nr:hypothetical protein [Fulvivirga sedimenti]MCA6078644.1 hypothetical protein [Fulvivirga sedimenti]
MMRNFLILMLLVLPFTGYSQVTGKFFPEMEAETVQDETVNLPVDTKGKYTLLGLAYSKKSEDDLNTWFEPVYLKFIAENKGLFSSFGYDVNVYFVPMFTGVKAAAAGTAKKKAAENIDARLLPHILFYKGDLKTYKDALAFDKKDVPYFFVLDEDGKIIYATTGSFSGKKMDEIESLLE